MSGITQEYTQSFVKDCIRGLPPACAAACPFGFDTKDFLSKAAKEKWTSAYKAYRNAVVFPAIVSENCPAPCRAGCAAAIAPDDYIDILSVERETVINAKKRDADFYAIAPKPDRVLVLGANYAGYACALILAQKQYAVTVVGNPDSIPDNHMEEIVRLIGKTPVVTVPGRPDGDFQAEWEAPSSGSIVYDIAQGKQQAIDIEVFLGMGKYPDKRVFKQTETFSGVSHAMQSPAAEAARCRQCDCSACMDACGMLKRFKKEPRKIALQMFTDAYVNPPLSTHVLTREAYSCTDCGKCKSVCPMGIDLGRLFYRYRRMREENGTAPDGFHDIFLRRMNEFNKNGRTIDPVQGSGKNYIFFPGCALKTDMPSTAEKTYEYLRDKYGAGLLEHCCGSPAVWAGIDSQETVQFSSNAIYLYACPSCGSELKKRGVNCEPVYEYLSALAMEAESGAAKQSCTLFHACSARENDELRDSVSRLAKRISHVDSEVLDCCGYGGQTQLVTPDLFRETVFESAGLADSPYIVYCANCRDTFKRAGKESRHILEIVFPGSDPALDDKRILSIAPDAAKMMEELLISKQDLLQVIDNAAECGGEYLMDDGVIAASLVIGSLTYWVSYRKTDAGYEILGAYYHRMKFRKAAGIK